MGIRGSIVRTLTATALLLLAPSCAHDVTDPSPSGTTGRGTLPNFVVILVDDQAWVGTSVRMDERVPASAGADYSTPNLERLAASGLRFSRAYAAAPLCSPSRAALQLGMSPARLHFTNNVSAGRQTELSREIDGAVIAPQQLRSLPEDRTTIAEWLKGHFPEYVTAHLGKWHLEGARRAGPAEHGYDVHDGPTGNESGYREVPWGPGKGEINFGPDDPKRIFSLSRRAAQFMEEQVRAGRPFYVQVSHYAVHEPPHARPETLERYGEEGTYAAMTEDLDAGLGIILDRIDALDIEGETYVFYISDNGGIGRGQNGPLARGKSTLWEGGIRVPILLKGPGVAEGVVSDEQVILWDLLPTLADILGKADALPGDLDGGSWKPLFAGGDEGSVERAAPGLLFHQPHYQLTRRRQSRQVRSYPQSALILGDHKLIKLYDGPEGPRVYLYNLSQDLGEQHDLVESMPDKAEQLERRLMDRLAQVGAQLPQSNPH